MAINARVRSVRPAGRWWSASLVGVALLLVGCQAKSASPTGAPPASSASASTAGASSAQPGHSSAATLSELVQQLDGCIHAHGSPNFPDPYVDQNGNVSFPASAPNLPAAAQTACQSIIDELPNPGNGAPTPLASATFQQWVQFAACMRSHGLPAWPDPNTDGSFPLPASLRTAQSTAIAPAFEACRGLDPNPNGKYTVSDGGS